MNRVLVALGVSLVLFSFSGLSQADVIDPFDNMAAPPGTFGLVNYFGHLDLPEIADNDGDTVDFDYDQSYWVLRPVYYAGKIADKMTWGVNAIIPVGHVSIDQGNSEFGLGDIGLSPFIFLYENPEKQIYLSFWEFVFFPTGSWDSDNFVNLGRDAWWFQHQLAFGWYPGKFGMDFNVNYFMYLESDDGKFDEPDALELETVLHYGITEKFRIGLNAAYWYGLADAEFDDVDIDDSKPTNFKLGANLMYTLQENFLVNFRWMHDIDSESYPEGDWYYLRFVYVF
jgi:hypothetical protein